MKDPGLAEVEGRLLLNPLLARLSERERLMINLRFVAGWSQTQIGALIGATQMQVSRMLARSLAQLGRGPSLSSTIGGGPGQGMSTGDGSHYGHLGVPAPCEPPHIVTTEPGLARSDRRAGRLARVRPGHRVPPGTDLLAPPGPCPGGLARPVPRAISLRLPSSTPLAVDPEPLAQVLAGPCVMVAHAATQDLEVLARACDVLPSQTVRHAGRGRLPGPWFRVPGLAGGAVPAGAADQRRPPHGLEPPAPHRAHSLRTPPPTSPTCWPWRTPSRPSWWPGAGWAGRRRKAPTLLARPQDQTDPDEAWWKLRDNRHLQGVSRAIAQEWRPGGRKRPALSMSSPAWYWPTWLCSRSPTPPRPTVAALRETRGIDARHLRGGRRRGHHGRCRPRQALPGEKLSVWPRPSR